MRMFEIIYYVERTGRVFTMMDKPKEWINVTSGWIVEEEPVYVRQQFCNQFYLYKVKIHSQYVGVNFYTRNNVYNYKFCFEDKSAAMHFRLKFDNDFEFEHLKYSTVKDY